jgi:hypothetical protein
MKLLILVFLIFVYLCSSAQNNPESDSLTIPTVHDVQSVLSLPEPLLPVSRISTELPFEFNPIFDNQKLLPDFTKKLGLNEARAFPYVYSQSFTNADLALNPFYVNGFVYNHASYRLNDRFSLGGSSYGMNSIFDPMKINSGIQQMDFRGATMFMQYKVSKNIRVETRVNISNHQTPWEP